jgi:hypothetical protein
MIQMMKMILSGKEAAVKKKVLGWVGYTDGKPFWERIVDDYTQVGDPPVRAANIYKSKKEARRRFEDVRPVYEK